MRSLFYSARACVSWTQMTCFMVPWRHTTSSVRDDTELCHAGIYWSTAHVWDNGKETTTKTTHRASRRAQAWKVIQQNVCSTTPLPWGDIDTNSNALVGMMSSELQQRHYYAQKQS